MIFGIKKIINFDPCTVFLANTTNIPQQLKTGFVVQGHKYVLLRVLLQGQAVVPQKVEF